MLNRITKITNRSLSERLEDNSNVDNLNSILNEIITHGKICKCIKKLNNDQLSRDDFIRNKFINPCPEMFFHYILFSFTSLLYIHVLSYIKNDRGIGSPVIEVSFYLMMHRIMCISVCDSYRTKSEDPFRMVCTPQCRNYKLFKFLSVDMEILIPWSSQVHPEARATGRWTGYIEVLQCGTISMPNGRHIDN